MGARITAKKNVKIFVLFLMENINYPLDFVSINDIVMQTDYVMYLDFAESFDELLEKYYNGENFYFLSTKGKRIYAEANFKDGDFLVFGRETRGLPEPLLEKYYDKTLRIPMIGESRSLNLANSVALTLYEAIRQNGFENLKTDGELTGRGY